MDLCRCCNGLDRIGSYLQVRACGQAGRQAAGQRLGSLEEDVALCLSLACLLNSSVTCGWALNNSAVVLRHTYVQYVVAAAATDLPLGSNQNEEQKPCHAMPCYATLCCAVL